MRKIHLVSFLFLLFTFLHSMGQGPVVDLGNDTLNCSGDQFVLDAGPGFVSYLWDDNSTGQTRSISNPGTYSVSVTNLSGVQSSDNINVGTAPNPTALIQGPDIRNVCPGEPIDLTATNLVLKAYLWSTGQTSGTISVENPGTYTVTVFNEYDCEDVDVVQVQSFPEPTVSIGGSSFLCEGGTQDLQAFGTNFVFWNWSTSETTPQIQITQPGTYSVEIRDANGCPGRDTINVINIPLPLVDLGGDIFLCDNETANLSVINGFKTYEWSTGESTSSITITEAGTYDVTVTDNFGCKNIPNPIDVTILPIDKPVITKVGPRFISSSAAEYQWFLNDVPVEQANGFVFFPEETGWIMVQIVAPNGCVEMSDPIYFDVGDDGNDLPQGISPNGDNINDQFDSDIFQFYPDASLRVFNRWGAEVFSESPYSGGWKGQNKSGSDLPVGTYYYILDLNDGFNPINGFIVVIR